MAYRYPPGQYLRGPRDRRLPGTPVDPPNINVYVTELSSTSVKVSWNLPYSGANNIKLYINHGYNLEYETNMNGWNTEITLINITPGKLYTATVEAYYSNGRRVTGSTNFRTSSYY